MTYVTATVMTGLMYDAALPGLLHQIFDAGFTYHTEPNDARI